MTSDPARESWAGQRAGLPAPPTLPPGGAEPPRRGRLILPVVALATVFALIAALLGLSGGGGSTATDTFRPSGGNAATGARAVVVNIDTAASNFGADGLRPLGAGSGVVLTAGGEILTNNHVVQGATRIRVTVTGRGTSTATVLGVDPTDDIALLQLDSVSGLTPARIGDSSTVQVGDPVTAIGNAFGRGGVPSVTTGSVTAINRTITASDPGGAGGSERLRGMIQTDASIVPGDSGGALVNGDGQVIGIITAGPRDSHAGSGGGFAIPIATAVSIARQIEAGQGSSRILIGERGFLGVAAAAVDAAAAAQLGLTDTSGALVTGVFPDTPADRAGMTAPAVIRTIDDRTIGSLNELGMVLHAKTPGERVTVTWVDTNGEHTATVALIAGPAV